VKLQRSQDLEKKAMRMSMVLYERVIRPLAFRFDAERMHNASLAMLARVGRSRWLREHYWRKYQVNDSRLTRQVGGLTVANPIGLAAGYDKNGVAVSGLESLGFGFLEIGSVSADASEGNPKPRLFRVPGHRAIVVNYGLPNVGAEAVVGNLNHIERRIPLGINLVNTNRLRCESEDVVMDDFQRAVKLTKDVADYLVLNLSCPNTESGREFFADRKYVVRLLELLSSEALSKPLFLKVSPLGGVAAIESLLEAVDPFRFVTGFIFNTPGGKPDGLGLTDQQTRDMPGAVTGPIHEATMNEAIANLYRRMDHQRFHIIGVGGVFTAEDAYRKIRLGASLVQLYTALVYRGPGVVREINRGLVDLLKRDGMSGIGDAVGVKFR
jgi:dihydroorotate dehydrogenase (fumarate)/dihydroorotate dehydrogenase